MATLTKSTGTVTLTGAVEKITLPAAYGWVWVKNMSDSDIFAGLSADISAGADGVLTIPAGECGRVQMDGSREFYLLGTGNALVVAQNYAECPFNSGAKGGEIPDLSEYAKKSDIPTELPANGGDADTVGGIQAADLRQITSNAIQTLPASPISEEDYFVLAGDSSFPYPYGNLSIRYGSGDHEFVAIYRTTGTDRNIWYNVCLQNADFSKSWMGWKEISTTPIKKISFQSVATNSGGGGNLFTADFGTPITIACTSRGDTQCTPFYYKDNNAWLLLAKDAATLDPIPIGTYSFDVWYI